MYLYFHQNIKKGGKMYLIVDLTPFYKTEKTIDSYRLIESFEYEEDAKAVLAALEAVNTNFNLYKIVKT
jgi:hypothetical protein